MIVITPGDPKGIGPEVSVRALRALSETGTPIPAILIGDVEAIRRCAADVVVVDTLAAAVALRAGTSAGRYGGARSALLVAVAPASGAEPVEVRSIREAVAACRAGVARAMVTGPIHKARLAAAGFHHAGHTDFLGELCGVSRPVMAFTGGQFRVALVTVHLPLRCVPDAVTLDAVLHTIRTADAALRQQLGLPRPRLLVCGLNPHAGDSGLLGREEIEVIGPAIARAHALGIHCEGPVSAETAFADPAASDMIVAMYHDQGLAPLKRGDFGRSVNWTLGLPIVRTSVDHGTADALVGTGSARHDSMLAAIQLADRLGAPATGEPS
ncbi:MAG: 4-hydroxythreonine-4-phosphate dehydrogenase PdxA [Myxococcales bacterium]|nr:4-hydroxythreonine-4-phosphate dehydrogenase PdxA [Myxococcales bacterium]